MTGEQDRKRQILAVLLVEYTEAGVPIEQIDGDHYAHFEALTASGRKVRASINITTLADQIVRNIR